MGDWTEPNDCDCCDRAKPGQDYHCPKCDAYWPAEEDPMDEIVKGMASAYHAAARSPHYSEDAMRAALAWLSERYKVAPEEVLSAIERKEQR